MIRKLAEDIDGIIGDALVEVSMSKGDAYADASEFFGKGVLPDGSKWARPITPFVGFDNEPKVSRVKRNQTKAGENYYARMRFAPGKGGGSGASIDAAASNHLFNMIGTDRKVILGVEKAFLPFVKKYSRVLNDQLRKWLKNHENYLHHIVGWGNKDAYVVDDVVFKSIRYENPMVDPNRRLWPAGKTEIWTPITADVVISIRRA